jgi:hypothetical protein
LPTGDGGRSLRRVDSSVRTGLLLAFGAIACALLFALLAGGAVALAITAGGVAVSGGQLPATSGYFVPLAVSIVSVVVLIATVRGSIVPALAALSAAVALAAMLLLNRSLVDFTPFLIAWLGSELLLATAVAIVLVSGGQHRTSAST